MKNLLSKVKMPGKKKNKKTSSHSEEEASSGSASATQLEVAEEAKEGVKLEPAKVEPEPTKPKVDVQKEAQVVEEILGKLKLDNEEYTTEEKLEALCLVFRETIAENLK